MSVIRCPSSDEKRAPALRLGEAVERVRARARVDERGEEPEERGEVMKNVGCDVRAGWPRPLKPRLHSAAFTAQRARDAACLRARPSSCEASRLAAQLMSLLLESHEVDWLQALEPEIAGWLQLSAGRLRSLAAVDREAITELRSLVDSYEERRAAAAE